MTEKHIAILEYMERFSNVHGYMPSFRELALKFGTSTSVISYYLDQLEESGWIARTPNVARSIRILDHSWQVQP